MWQFVRFSAVGAIGTAVHYAVLLTLVEWLTVGPVIASSIGATCGAVVNYFLNYHFTFASSRAHAVAAPLFMVVAATGLALNGVLMAVFLSVPGMRYLLAQVAATAFVLLWTFGLNRFVTFRV